METTIENYYEQICEDIIKIYGKLDEMIKTIIDIELEYERQQTGKTDDNTSSGN